MTIQSSISIKELISAIRNVPDFPKPGILFRDITPLLGQPNLFKKAIDEMCKPYRAARIDHIVGIEARGFLLASAMAYKMNAGLVPIRKKGKLPAQKARITYDLEYGQDMLEVHEDAFSRGNQVLIADDVLATGGTAKAAAELAEKAGAKIVGISFLIELAALKGREKISRHPSIHSVICFS